LAKLLAVGQKTRRCPHARKAFFYGRLLGRRSSGTQVKEAFQTLPVMPPLGFAQKVVGDTPYQNRER
jgi:hypothetical protein